MRYLAIDLGDKRSGLAVGDDITTISSPYDTISTSSHNQCIKNILSAVEDIGPDALVIGLPLNMDGTISKQAEKTKEFARQLKQKCDLPLHFMDERQSSQTANWQMSQSGLTHKQKKNRRDALAAAAILKRFLNKEKDL